MTSPSTCSDLTLSLSPARIGRKFQKPTVFEALTVAENLELALKGDKSVWASLRARLNGEQETASATFCACCVLMANVRARRGCFLTGKNSFSRSACCWFRSRICCCWMSPPPG